MKKYQLDLNKIASYRKKGMDQMIENYIKSFSTLYDLKSYIVYDIKNFPKKTGVPIGDSFLFFTIKNLSGIEKIGVERC